MERRFFQDVEEESDSDEAFKALEATQRQYCTDLKSKLYLPELRGIAKSFEIPKYSKMNKGQLCDVISQYLVLSQETGYNPGEVLELVRLIESLRAGAEAGAGTN